MGEEGKWGGKRGKGKHFPLLGRRENGRGKKMGEENSVGPSPIFPPTFSSQNGGILGQIFCSHSLPFIARLFLSFLSPFSQNLLLLLLYSFLSQCPTPHISESSFLPLLLSSTVRSFFTISSFLPCLLAIFLLPLNSSMCFFSSSTDI